jgi:hypothetical protein
VAKRRLAKVAEGGEKRVEKSMSLRERMTWSKRNLFLNHFLK